ncbi:hypothetical protein BLOT_008265 [Blomia tropicalis]|nr:hypothetical protein BLOT_008265 [Blomia tropicalis]
MKKDRPCQSDGRHVRWSWSMVYGEPVRSTVLLGGGYQNKVYQLYKITTEYVTQTSDYLYMCQQSSPKWVSSYTFDTQTIAYTPNTLEHPTLPPNVPVFHSFVLPNRHKH